MKVIDICNLTKDYGNHRGNFDVTFHVDKGEIVGFLGPNGAGKTTTIRQLMGFIKPDKGNASINGMNCFDNADVIQKTLGYLPGEIAFIDEMTGDDFIRFVGKMRGMKSFSYANELVETFELNSGGKIKKMSKGMKQKIGIICAFMHDPDVLILDEPTSGLDPLMQNKFVDLVLQHKERGKTILMSSHIFEEVEKTCHRVAIIKDGEIVAVKSIEELQKSKRKVFEVSFESKDDALKFSQAVLNCSINNNLVSVSTKDINSFLKQLSDFKIKDLSIKTQTLEELFMHFYGGEVGE